MEWVLLFTFCLALLQWPTSDRNELHSYFMATARRQWHFNMVYGTQNRDSKIECYIFVSVCVCVLATKRSSEATQGKTPLSNERNAMKNCKYFNQKSTKCSRYSNENGKNALDEMSISHIWTDQLVIDIEPQNRNASSTTQFLKTSVKPWTIYLRFL